MSAPRTALSATQTARRRPEGLGSCLCGAEGLATCSCAWGSMITDLIAYGYHADAETRACLAPSLTKKVQGLFTIARQHAVAEFDAWGRLAGLSQKQRADRLGFTPGRLRQFLTGLTDQAPRKR